MMNCCRALCGVALVGLLLVSQSQNASGDTEEDWVGTYSVYSRKWTGEYFPTDETIKEVRISQEGDRYVLHHHRDHLLKLSGGSLVPTDDNPSPVVVPQTGSGPGVFELRFDFQQLYLVKDKVPSNWAMVGEQIEIDESKFENLNSGQSRVLSAGIPKELKREYCKLLRWRECNCNLETFWLADAALLIDKNWERQYDIPKYRAFVFTEDLKSFDPSLKTVFAYKGCYHFRTAKFEMSWIETAAKNWRLYRFVSRDEGDDSNRLSFGKESDGEFGTLKANGASTELIPQKHPWKYTVWDVRRERIDPKTSQDAISGIVSHFNTGTPMENIPLFFGRGNDVPVLVATSNAKGRFSFRVPASKPDEELADESNVTKYYLYVGGSITSEKQSVPSGITANSTKHVLKAGSNTRRFEIGKLIK